MPKGCAGLRLSPEAQPDEGLGNRHILAPLDAGRAAHHQRLEYSAQRQGLTRQVLRAQISTPALRLSADQLYQRFKVALTHSQPRPSGDR